MFISTSGRFPLVGANANNRRGKVGDNENTSEVAHLKSQFSTWFFRAIGENMLGKGIGASVNVGCFNLISLLSYLLFTVYSAILFFFFQPLLSRRYSAHRVYTPFSSFCIFLNIANLLLRKKKKTTATDGFRIFHFNCSRYEFPEFAPATDRI